VTIGFTLPTVSRETYDHLINVSVPLGSCCNVKFGLQAKDCSLVEEKNLLQKIEMKKRKNVG